MITNKILIWDTKKDAEQFKQFIKEILEEIDKEYYGRGIGLRTKEHIVKIINEKLGEEKSK